MNYEIIRGDSFETLQRFQAEGRKFDAILTDPPYCSRPGGSYGSGARKYVNLARAGSRLEDCNFSEAPNQFAAYEFARHWMQASALVLRAPGYFFCFTDWVMIPAFTMAMQSSGIVYRGLIPWNKNNARCHPGYFTQVCEFVIWGTVNGVSDKFVKGYLEGSAPANELRVHPTQKNETVCAELLRILPDEATEVLDPFCGSATTGAACARFGYHFVGVENVPKIADVAENRLRNTTWAQRLTADKEAKEWTEQTPAFW